MLRQFPVYERGKSYIATIHDIDDIDGLDAVAALDAEAFGGHVSFGREELKTVAAHGFVMSVSEGSGSKVSDMILEMQVVTEAIPTAVEPLVYDLPSNCAYLAGMAKRPGVQIPRLGQLGVTLREDIAMYANPTIDYMLTGCRPENGRILRILTCLGYVGMAILGEYYPRFHEAGTPYKPAPDITRDSGARMVLTKSLRNPRRVGSRCLSIHCTEIAVTDDDQPDAEARACMRDLLGERLLTGVRCKENGKFVAHFCKTFLDRPAISRLYRE